MKKDELIAILRSGSWATTGAENLSWQPIKSGYITVKEIYTNIKNHRISYANVSCVYSTSLNIEFIILLIKRHLQYVTTKSNVTLCRYYKHFSDYIKNTPKIHLF